MLLIFFAAALLAQDKPFEGELQEILRSPIKAQFDTTKPGHQLELCVADSLSIAGAPSVLRDGLDDVVMVAPNGASGSYLAAVSIRKTESGSHIDLRVRGKGWDDRLKMRINTCL